MTNFGRYSEGVKALGLQCAFGSALPELGDLDRYEFSVRSLDDPPSRGGKAYWLFLIIPGRPNVVKSTQLRPPPRSCGISGTNFVLSQQQWQRVLGAAMPFSDRS